MGSDISTKNNSGSRSDEEAFQNSRSFLSIEDQAEIIRFIESRKVRALEPILPEEAPTEGHLRSSYSSRILEDWSLETLTGINLRNVEGRITGNVGFPGRKSAPGAGGGDDDDDGNDPYAPRDSGPRPARIDPKFTLASVGGLDDHIGYLKRAVMYPLKHQRGLKEWGVEPPKGIMFHGPPGTGKTLLAKALANEISAATGKNVAFFYHKGGESFSKWFGESSENLRKLFNAAKRHKPAIIFLDEIDGLCPEREKASQSTPAYATVVTTMLGLIDSVKRGDIFLIGATNRLDAVDPAIRRPGRFDKELTFSLPDEESRKRILSIHSSKWPRNHPEGELLTELAKKTVGYTGADLEKLCSDTLIVMMARSEKTKTNEVTIIREDWMTALQQMTPSDSNVFGSSILVTQPPIKQIHPLINNIIGEILTKLRPQLLQSMALNAPYVGRKSLLVWDTNNADFEDFTNLTIMRGLLSDPLLSKMDTYIFDQDKAFNLIQRYSLLGALTHTVDQVRAAEKPAILFIPGIGSMEKEFAKHYGKLFHRVLSRIQGSNTILIGTYCGKIQDLSPTLKDLFDGTTHNHLVRRANNFERQAFFQQVFTPDLMEAADKLSKKSKLEKGTTKTKYSDVLETGLHRVVELTEGDPLGHLLTLYDVLNGIKAKYFDSEGLTDFKILSEEFDQQIELYARRKEV